MKNKARLSEDYRQLKRKIFFKALLMAVAAMAIIWLLYRFVLYGNFADWTIALLEKVFRMEHFDAYHLYVKIFRKNMDIFFLVGVVIAFFALFRVYLNWFAKYFVEVNRGIDALIQEDEGEVVLSAELAATEKKINAIKRTLEKRKLDTQMAEQQKNDLIVYLAHDLKTPLTTVIGYLTLLRDEPDLSVPTRAKYANIALDKAERLEVLINEFFDITRFSLTQMTLERETVNLTRMLEQIAHEFHPVLSAEELSLDMVLSPNIQISCDADKLQRVFDNLFRNAIHYSKDRKSIEVSLTQAGNNAVMRITNYGKNIPPEKLQRVFDQFFRLDSSRSSTTGGAGLGLAIAKGIVELHGGTIIAESQEERITFTVTLPASVRKS